MSMKTTIDINEIKDKSVHTGLLEALFHLRQASEIVSSIQSETEISKYKHRWVKLDDIQDGLNSNSCALGEIISEIIFERLDDMARQA